MGYRRMDLLARRFPSRISSTTHLPPLYFLVSPKESPVLLEFGVV